MEAGRERSDPAEAEALALGLRKLPAPKDFPVILAARMSLSFPLLLSAVPLWSIDHDTLPSARHFRRCWFSDGAIRSNFPMHLFDDLVPPWPTFGIDLEPKIQGRDMVFLPNKYTEQYGERCNHFDERPTAASRFGGTSKPSYRPCRTGTITRCRACQAFETVSPECDWRRMKAA